jgi:hypothetical protein
MLCMQPSSLRCVAISVILWGLLFCNGCESANAQGSWVGRAFYLSTQHVNGSQALGVCATGYHMANLAEIIDVSVLQYDVVRGQKADDSGSGPPWGLDGWVRTGSPASRVWASGGGLGNCSVWTTASHENSGTVVRLTMPWGANSTIGAPYSVPPTMGIAPWQTRTIRSAREPDQSSRCDELNAVWCVQN